MKRVIISPLPPLPPPPASPFPLPPERTITNNWQHLDASVQGEGKTRDRRLSELEAATTTAVEGSSKVSGRLGILEGTAEAGLETLRVKQKAFFLPLILVYLFIYRSTTGRCTYF